MKSIGNPKTIRKNGILNKTARTQGAAGFSLLELLIVVAIIGIIASLAIPRLAAARMAANQASAVQTLRTYHNGEMIFSTTYTNGRYFLADFVQLRTTTNAIDEAISSGAPSSVVNQKAGYLFYIGENILPNNASLNDTSAPTVNGNPTYAAYHVRANPVALNGVGATGKKSFYIDYSGVIRRNNGALNADVNSEPLNSQN